VILTATLGYGVHGSESDVIEGAMFQGSARRGCSITSTARASWPTTSAPLLLMRSS
jgi:hypothetical protein